MLGVQSSNKPISGVFAQQFAEQLQVAVDARNHLTKLTEKILNDNGYIKCTDGSFPFDGTMLTYENEDKSVMFVYDPSCQNKDEWWCYIQRCILEDDFIDIYVEHFNKFLSEFNCETLKIY